MVRNVICAENSRENKISVNIENPLDRNDNMPCGCKEFVKKKEKTRKEKQERNWREFDISLSRNVCENPHLYPSFVHG